MYCLTDLDFAEVEQVAFSPANLVPGIAVSDDKLLQGRLFACTDAARFFRFNSRYRLGANFTQIPINAPYTTRAHNYQRDGAMCVNGNGGSSINYERPKTEDVPDPVDSITHQNGKMQGPGRYNCTTADDGNQAGVFWRSVLKLEERKRVVSRIVKSLKGVKGHICARVVAYIKVGDEDWGRMVEEGLLLKARV